MGYCVRCGKMTSTAFPFCNKCFEKVLVRDTEVKYPRPQKAAFLHPKEGPAIGVVKAQINAAGDTKYYIGTCTGDGNHGNVMQIIKKRNINVKSGFRPEVLGGCHGTALSID